MIICSWMMQFSIILGEKRKHTEHKFYHDIIPENTYTILQYFGNLQFPHYQQFLNVIRTFFFYEKKFKLERIFFNVLQDTKLKPAKTFSTWAILAGRPELLKKKKNTTNN